MARRKVYNVPIVQKTILHVKVVASSKEEALEIAQHEDCEWSNEKEEVLGTSYKEPVPNTDYHDTQYAYYRDETGTVRHTRIENIFYQPK